VRDAREGHSDAKAGANDVSRWGTPAQEAGQQRGHYEDDKEDHFASPLAMRGKLDTAKIASLSNLVNA
jgi:hypothetical protein